MNEGDRVVLTDVDDVSRKRGFDTGMIGTITLVSFNVGGACDMIDISVRGVGAATFYRQEFTVLEDIDEYD